MIEGVVVNRFRGISQGTVEGLKQVTVLVGRNGVGKSSILEALYLASACAGIRDEVRGVDKLDYIVNRRGGRGTWDSRWLLWYMGETKNPAEIQLKIRGEAFKFIVVNARKESHPVRLVGENEILIELEGGYWVKDVLDVEKGFSPGRVDIVGKLAEIREFLRGFLLVDDILARRPSAIESYAWPRVLARRLDRDVINVIREEFEPEAEGLTYAPSSEGYYYLALQTAKTAIRVDDLGDGVRNALLLAMLVLAYKPTVLLIEEPELHMHPAGLHTFMKFLMRLAKSISCQIIAATHSIELEQVAEALARELGVEFTALYVEREEGVLKVRSFSIDDVETLRRLGVDIRLLHRF